MFNKVVKKYSVFLGVGVAIAGIPVTYLILKYSFYLGLLVGKYLRIL